MSNSVNEKTVAAFKADVMTACPSLVTLKERGITKQLPDQIFETIFREVYDGDLSLARDVIYGRMDRLRNSDADKAIERIGNMNEAASLVQQAVQQKNPILLISDTDNDGSLSQAIAMEAKRLFDADMYVKPKDYHPENHGFSIEQIETWVAEIGLKRDDSFSVIIADLGTNQRKEQDIFLATYPRANLIIADHHAPSEDKVNSYAVRSLLVSPHTKGSMGLSVRNGGGVSGGYLLYTIFKLAAQRMVKDNTLNHTQESLTDALQPMQDLGRAANLLDMVNCDIRIKPLQEYDINKAFDLSNLTANGRSLSKWMSDKQPEYLKALSPLVGDENTEEFLQIRLKMLEQNNVARGLRELINDVYASPSPDSPISENANDLSENEEGNDDPENAESNDLDGGTSTFPLHDKILSYIASTPVESSYETNFVELLRPYLFNLSYEKRFNSKVKDEWISLASNCLKEVGRLDRQIKNLLREHSLVKQISEDYAIVTQPSNAIVERAFSARQLDTAYQSLDKTVKLSVVAVRNNQIILSSRSNVSMHEIIRDAETAFPDADLIYRGHGGAGALTVVRRTSASGDNFTPLLEKLISYLNNEAKNLVDGQDIKRSVRVEPIHLPLIKEIFHKTRGHLVPGALPDFIMKITEQSVFEDTYTMEDKTVKDLVQENEWNTTVESLTFDGSQKLFLPNQALKTLANDGFKGALAMRLGQDGSLSAIKAYSGKQLENKDIPLLMLPVEKERMDLAAFYQKHFKDRDYPSITVSRDEAISHIKFVANPEEAFNHFEESVLALLAETNTDTKCVLDVEAKGGVNAKCINVGLALFSKDPKAGVVVTDEEFHRMASVPNAEIDNYRYLPDGKVIFNERIKIEIVSQLDAYDQDKPTYAPLKAQILTNLTTEMLHENGIPSEEVQKNLLNVLKGKGRLLFQAFNLPYDNNIVRVNYPELYELMNNSVQLDAAVPAKEKHIAYTALKVNDLGTGKSAIEFYNAETPGYNLSTLLSDRTKTRFSYPSIKGTHILHVSGEEVTIFDKASMRSSLYPLSRTELIDTLMPNLQPIKDPKYGVEKLLRVATIRDMIDHQPIKETIYVPFEPVGGIQLDDELWAHFQTHYAFEKDLDSNINDFCKLPEVKEIMDIRFSLSKEEAPAELTLARSIGKKDEFDPNKTYKTEKAMKGHEEKLAAFQGHHVLKMNALTFLKANQENAERYARSWVYELVLAAHEATEKEPSASLISGISDLTGVDIDMLKTVYDETYRYRKFRGIQSYRVHETHNNIGLEGDAYQEAIVFLHMLRLKERNPFLVGDISRRNRMIASRPVIDILTRQAAASTFLQASRLATQTVMNEDVFNSYGEKQIDQFSSKHTRGQVPMMKCKTLSDDKSEVHLMLPDYNPQAWRDMPKNERKMWEEKIEMAVSLLVLSLSRDKASPEIKTIIEDLVTRPENLELFKDIKAHFGTVKASTLKDQIKKLFSSCGDAIIDGAQMTTVKVDGPPNSKGKPTKISQEQLVVKLAANKDIPPEALDHCLEIISETITRLEKEQGFISRSSIELIKDAFFVAKAQYLGYQAARERGDYVLSVDGYPTIAGNGKRSQTDMLKLQGKILQAHLDVFPDLASTLLTTKNNPSQFLVYSPMLQHVMDHTPGLDSAPDRLRVKGLRYS